MKNKIKAVVIDDSAFMRKAISIMLEDDKEIDVVATAKNGQEGYDLVKEIKPDIVTLDIEMPIMDGLTALEKIMKDCPTSVLMISSLTTEGAEATIKALELGAVDFIPKELSYVNVNIINIKDDLIKKVKAIVSQRTLRSRIGKATKRVGISDATIPAKYQNKKLPSLNYKAVGLGISTGGPMSLQQVVPKLKEDLRIPVFIVQHMPPKFTKSLADRLDNISKVKVKEAEDGEIVRGGTVYIAPGGFHMIFQKTDGELKIKITDKPADSLHKPSVDTMLNSITDVYGKHLLGVIMTGMGRDGMLGIKKLKELGGHCLAQNEASCVVYGMPRAIVDNELADVVAPLEKISEIINEVV